MNHALSPETLAAQAMGDVDATSGALVPAIHPSTTYERGPDGTYRSGLVYTRADNPTYDHAERLLATLEGGAAGMLFASGSAAATAVFQSLLPGDHVLVSRVLYWGVRKWLAEFGIAWGLDVEFIDTTDLGAARTAIRPGRTRLVWVETPANPTWDITDLAAVAAIAHAADVRMVVDGTVATPVLTRPIEFGADLVVHSATKYLNGHGDVLAGAVVSARRDPFWERIRSWRRNAGCVLGPFEAWLLQRGMRTLFVRVRRSSESAFALARHFHGHPALTPVLYPGLPSPPGHEIAARRPASETGRCHHRSRPTWLLQLPQPLSAASRRSSSHAVARCAWSPSTMASSRWRRADRLARSFPRPRASRRFCAGPCPRSPRCGSCGRTQSRRGPPNPTSSPNASAGSWTTR